MHLPIKIKGRNCWRVGLMQIGFMLLLFSLPGVGNSLEVDPLHTPQLNRNILFSTLSVKDGLAQAAVNAITQDHQGFIWFGTQEGLSRYNGYRIDNYYHDADEPESLSHDWVWTLLEDRDGTLWLGTDGGGLNRYNFENATFT